MTSMNEHGKAVLIGLALVIVTATVYWQVGGFDFVRYDDDRYITENPIVSKGLSPEGIRWAFSSFEQSNWHPLTWLSHMLDVQWFGLDAGRHHQVNLLFHILNTLILFFVMQRMTGALWKSGFVAALFALHPLHVESVAWIAERKDVLSAFFFLLTLLAYERYARRQSPWGYLLVVVLFALGLLSKPMVVTLPFVLLLLDFWPLERFRSEFRGGDASADSTAGAGAISWIKANRGLFLEKIPLFALSAASCAVTLIAQQSAMKALEVVPLDFRILNAMVAYTEYLYRCFVPVDLAVLYPYPGSIAPWKVFASAAVLIAVTALVILRRKTPALRVGWFWYLGTLVPVIGLVQVGVQATADRYTYIPFIGLFIMLTWLVADLSAWVPHRRAVLASAAVLTLAGLSAVTVSQTGYWVNSEVLFEHTLQTTKENYVIHCNLGAYLAGQGRVDDAIRHYNEALRIKPDDGDTHYNLANVLARQAKCPEAVAHYREAVKNAPDSIMARNNMAICLIQTGDRQAAIEQFQEILRLKPEFEPARRNLAMLLAQETMKKTAGAGRVSERAEGGSLKEQMRLGQEAVKRGDLDTAILHFREALRIDPDNPGAHVGLGLALAYKGELDEAIRHFRAALKRDPENAEVQNSLGVALMQKGQLDEAQAHLQKAIKINPRFAKPHNSLGVLFARKGKLDEAVGQFQEALRIDPSNKDAEKNLALVQNLRTKSR